MRRIHSGTASFPDQIASSSFDGLPFQKLCRLCCLQNNFRSPRSHFCSSFLWRKIVKTIKSRESQKLVKLGGVVCLVTVHGYEKSKFSIDVAISKRSQLLEPLRQPFLTSFNICLRVLPKRTLSNLIFLYFYCSLFFCRFFFLSLTV